MVLLASVRLSHPSGLHGHRYHLLANLAVIPLEQQGQPVKSGVTVEFELIPMHPGLEEKLSLSLFWIEGEFEFP